MKLDEKKQLLIIAAFCGLVFCGEFVIGWGLKSDNDALDAQLVKLDTRKASAEAKIVTIPEMKEKASVLSNIVRDYTAILPQKDEVMQDAFVDTITGLCRSSGLTILTAVPMTVRVKSPKRRIPNQVVEEKEAFTRHKYRFEMTGEFSQLHRFINSVENHPRFLRVDGIQLFPVGDRSDLVTASQPTKLLTVEISTYVYDEPRTQMEAIQ
ncbi:MAG: type 4a pilus biogenesis protein PilO [Planctomycetota bacterium]|nr:type 4a pilus biogenesis protein PilO [Planctomycetota bacterium]